jgi:hypothetical protein
VNPSQSTLRLPKDPNYQRLFKGSSSLLSTATGWLGNGHLLLVEIQLYAETYSRIALHDIEAIVVRPTRTGLITVIIVGCFFLITALPGAGAIAFSLRSGGSPPVWGISLSIIGGVFLCILLFCLRNLHSCHVFIKTAVQTRRIPGLRTRRRAERFIATLRSELAQSASPAAAPSGPMTGDSTLENPSAAESSVEPPAIDSPGNTSEPWRSAPTS